MASCRDWAEAVVLAEKLGKLANVRSDGSNVVELSTQKFGQLRGACDTVMSPATWNNMLVQQVPRQLAAACAKLLEKSLLVPTTITTSSSKSSSTTPNTSTNSTPALPTSSIAIAVIGCSAVDTLMTTLLCRANADLHMESATPNEQAVCFRQQMQASGLLRLLPQLLSNLAARIETECGLSAQLRAGVQPLTDSDSSTGAQQQQGSGSTDNSLAGAASSVLLYLGIPAALQLFRCLSWAWRPGVFVADVLPEATEPLIRLCWLSIQRIHVQLQELTPASGHSNTRRILVSVSDTWNAVAQALPVAAQYIEIDSAATRQHSARVQASAFALPCLAYLVTVQAYGLLLAQLPTLPASGAAQGPASNADGSTSTSTTDSNTAGGSSSSSSSSGGSSSSTRLASISSFPVEIFFKGSLEKDSATAAAWQLACAEFPKVPATHDKLLRMLGSSPLSALYCAACTIGEAARQTEAPGSRASSSTGSSSSSRRATPRVPAADVSAIHRAFNTSLSCIKHFQCHQVSVLGAPATPAAHFQILSLLMPVLLFWCAHQPPHLGGEVADCTKAVTAALLAHFRVEASGCVDDWLCQLVAKEVLPLASAVATNLINHLSSNSGSSGSGRKKSSQRATAGSKTPELAAQQLYLLLRMCSSHLQVGPNVEVAQPVAVQLLEAVARGWQNWGQDVSAEQRVGVMLQLLETVGPSSSDPASWSHWATDSESQLVGLCFSVLKALTTMCAVHPNLCSSADALRCCKFVAAATVSGLLHCASSEPPAALAAAVPWLVLSGRLLLFVAAQLPTPSGDSYASIKSTGMFAWLQLTDAAGALSAAGYDPSGSLMQQLQAVCDAADSSSGMADTSQLQSLGQALNTLPFACACNNPACTNLSGADEVKLVNGKNCVCSGCRASRFCSRACQVRHWKQHREVCRAVAAKVAAASGQAAAAADAGADAGSAP